MEIVLHVNCPLFLSDFKETLFSRPIFEKYSNIIFRENPSNGSRVVPCGRTDITKLIVAFGNFANAPEKKINISGNYSKVICIVSNDCRNVRQVANTGKYLSELGSK